MKTYAILWCFLGLGLLTGAQNNPQPTPNNPAGTPQPATAQQSNTPQQGAAGSKPADDTIHITGICKYRTDNDIDVSVGDYIMVKMSKDMLDKASANQKALRLWMNGSCLTNTAPLYADYKASAMVFRLERDTSQSSPWRTLYNFQLKQKAEFSLGTKDKEFGKNRYTLYLMTSTWWERVIAVVLMFALIGILYGFRRRWFRDTGYYTKDGVIIGFGKNEPTDVVLGRINISDITYSLARFQFVVWFTMVFCSLVYIWGFSGIMMTPSGTALILLTISATTLLAGKMLDGVPTREIAANPGTPAVPATPQLIVQKFLNEKQGTKGFFIDMLCDGVSISIHRLQLLLFTAFLAIYFIIKVFTTFAMPEFDTTMLTLMGISGGTYVGLKATEK